MSFEELIKLTQGYNITTEIPLRFYKSLQKLRITIDSSHVTIIRSLDTKLIGNNYLPIHLELTNSDNKSFYKYLTPNKQTFN